VRILRFVTLNLWGAEEPLATRMALVEGELRALAPDVIALQEVREVPGRLANQAETLARALGIHHVFAPAVEFGGGHEGLAILSRFPVVEQIPVRLPHATDVEGRILLSARIDLGGGDSIWTHTTHLNYRLAHGKQREDQLLAAEAAIATHVNDRPHVWMGDFNARPESDEIRWLRGLTTLGGRRTAWQDAWARLYPADPGWTWASSNPATQALRFLEPDRRLDYIFVTPERKDGRGRIHACRIVFDRPNPEGVFASDHYGLLADVQIDPDRAPSTPPVVI
jgi:endonuclease/exonuclease/phosphatase family metal-dependent hydrolase